MKIVHTGDWHIGKIVNQAYMTEDQEYALEALIRLLEEERPDALVVAGDIYDRAVPPVEAVDLLDRTLRRIVTGLGIPVLMIAGNHDSPDRLGFGSELFRTQGLYIEGRFRPSPARVVLHDDHGPVNFYLVPYAPPAVVRDGLGCPEVRDHDSAMRALVTQIRAEWDPAQRNVLVTHGFVRGTGEPELSDSEKPLSLTLSVGGAESVDAAHFAGFTYTALGHLHGPQRTDADTVRYAGSLLKYSFSETGQEKSVSLVTIDAGGGVTHECRTLPVRRDMRRIRGPLRELLSPAVYSGANTEDYLHVTLTDEGELLEPMSKLRAVYPNVLALEIEKTAHRTGEAKTAAAAGYKQKTRLVLFRDFFTDITGREFDAAREQVAAAAIGKAEAEERGA